jgi:type IV secretory pathway ATPase VirB11/archaellum biosynthesis ATPase
VAEQKAPDPRKRVRVVREETGPVIKLGKAAPPAEASPPPPEAVLRAAKEPEGRRPGAIAAAMKAMDIRPIGTGIKKVFETHRQVRPAFSYSWVDPSVPDDADLITSYAVEEVQVKVYHLPDETESFYHFVPPEYSLSRQWMELIHRVRAELSEHHPKTINLERPEQARSYVTRVGERIIRQVARRNDISLGRSNAEEAANVQRLAAVLAKYTAGFGVSETFLSDPHIHDIYVDAPASENPVYVSMGGIGDPRFTGRCRTNVTLGEEDVEALLSRFRYESGRPFSEAFPILEHNLEVYGARVTVIGKPLSPEGIAMAIRRHSGDPWTLLKLIDVGSLSPRAAALLSFLIDGRSTILVAGSRGAGKSSLLGALMMEFPQSQRIITIEDTLELPTMAMQNLGYKVQSMFVQSSLGGKGEMTADEALRVSLRLGESALVLGEVRGQEARTLYEAMRAGTAGSSVLGTFHADSARAVFERVVHDMGIPPKSFGATDVVVIAGVTRPGGVQKDVRRVTQIAEVLKESGVDGDFQDLMTYDDARDALVETDAMKYSSEKVGKIAASWGMSMEDALRNIDMRAAIKEKIVETARALNAPELLSAPWVVRANNKLWNLIEAHAAGGRIDYPAVESEWMAWFEGSARYAGG